MVPEPTLSSADVVRHIIDFVVAARLQCVVLEDSVLYGSRMIAHLASILLMLPPLLNVLAESQELELLPGKSK